MLKHRTDPCFRFRGVVEIGRGGHGAHELRKMLAQPRADHLPGIAGSKDFLRRLFQHLQRLCGVSAGDATGLNQTAQQRGADTATDLPERIVLLIVAREIREQATPCGGPRHPIRALPRQGHRDEVVLQQTGCMTQQMRLAETGARRADQQHAFTGPQGAQLIDGALVERHVPLLIGIVPRLTNVAPKRLHELQRLLAGSNVVFLRL